MSLSKHSSNIWLIILFFLHVNVVAAQVKIECCKISQTMPAFRADSNFKHDTYRELCAKNILKPINQSNAQVEIRLSALSPQFDREIWVIKCEDGQIKLTTYQSTMVGINDKKNKQVPSEYKSFKDIGPEKPGDNLVTLLKVSDLTSAYNSYDWNLFFSRLIGDHLFDIPEGREFVTYVIFASHVSKYPQGELSYVFEIKVGNQYRNLRYDGIFSQDEFKKNGLVKNQIDFIELITGLSRNDKN